MFMFIQKPLNSPHPDPVYRPILFCLTCLPFFEPADVNKHQAIIIQDAYQCMVYDVRFTNDECSIYSLGHNGSFQQWSISESPTRKVDFAVIEENDLRVPRGKVFAFASNDKHVMFCSSQGLNVYEVNKLW